MRGKASALCISLWPAHRVLRSPAQAACRGRSACRQVDQAAGVAVGCMPRDPTWRTLPTEAGQQAHWALRGALQRHRGRSAADLGRRLAWPRDAAACSVGKAPLLSIRHWQAPLSHGCQQGWTPFPAQLSSAEHKAPHVSPITLLFSGSSSRHQPQHSKGPSQHVRCQSLLLAMHWPLMQ